MTAGSFTNRWLLVGLLVLYALAMVWIALSALYSLTSKPSLVYCTGLLAAFGLQLSTMKLRRAVLAPVFCGAALPALALVVGWAYVHMTFPSDTDGSISAGDVAQVIMLLAAASATAAALVGLTAGAGRKLQSVAGVPARAIFAAATFAAIAILSVAFWKYPYL